MPSESHALAHAAALGMMSAYVSSALHYLKHESTTEDGRKTVQQAADFYRLFSAMTVDEKAAWYENGCLDLTAPAPAVPATPLPGLVTGEEIQACLRRTG